MTLNELLLEWSYRSEKGYPSLDSPSDVLVLKEILNKLNLPSNTILNRLSEQDPSPLSVGELRKERDPHRADIFLQKVEKGEEFELMNGSKIIIDKEQSSESLEYLQNKNFPSRLKLTFTDTSGNTHSINSFLKTAEFGAGAGSGAGSVDTRIMESAHCYGCAIAYYVLNRNITKEDLIRENFEQASSHVVVDASIDEIEAFLERKPLWYESTVKSVNKIYELFPNKNYKFHRGSEQVERIYNAWKNSLERQDKKLDQYQTMRDDKWNPSDIWLMTDKVSNFDWSGNLEVLNGQISQFYEDSDLIGVSLKMIGKNAGAVVKIFNDPGIPPGNVYEYEGYKTTPKSSGLEILYTGGSITCRNFDVVKGWSTEIKGKAAQGGKCGHTGVNDILKINNLTELPNQQGTVDAFKENNQEYYNKFYYLYDRFIENINKEDFKVKYDESKLSWKTGNYMGLEFLVKLEDNEGVRDEVLNDIMRYASSSTKFSSQFIKIS